MHRRPYNLYCVGADVKPCSINQAIVVNARSETLPIADFLLGTGSLKFNPVGYITSLHAKFHLHPCSIFSSRHVYKKTDAQKKRTDRKRPLKRI